MESQVSPVNLWPNPRSSKFWEQKVIPKIKFWPVVTFASLYAENGGINIRKREPRDTEKNGNGNRKDCTRAHKRGVANSGSLCAVVVASLARVSIATWPRPIPPVIKPTRQSQ